MVRILLVIVWLGVTVYAIADWSRTPDEEMPGRIPRMMWLIIVLLTIPSFSVGAVVWLIVRAVSRAQAGRDGELPTNRPLFPRSAHGGRPTAPPQPSAPDDDPDFLFKLERDIRRRRADEERQHKPNGGTLPPSAGGPGTADGLDAGPDENPNPDTDPNDGHDVDGTAGTSH